ncbi:Contactin-associated protein-like 2 [Holothuria leucospilota]|uniref:Contactin-associated protein-like 2 n=1 Tax=Holothuria leucospilota TaxID=206669 RepID=A0A9Q1CRS5_HOLLE|nr:Contactin-associated protein-like 2 [Holothuria leucospilota]
MEDNLSRFICTRETSSSISGDQQDVVWTVIDHDAENDEDIPAGSTSPGSFTREITYNDVSMEHLTYIIDHSQYCEQAVSYTCNSAKLLNSPGGDPFGWWVDRDDRQVYSWGGAVINSRKCACGMTGDCSDPNKFCNCDADSTSGEIDEGVLKEKERLPVTKLQFGDNEAGRSSASFHLGKLRCHGDVASEAHAEEVSDYLI